jgi:LAS superfamily LD-carboxypeptidase LdcB
MRKKLIKILFILIFIIVIFILLKYVFFNTKTISLDDKLKNLGYTTAEIEQINTLNNPDSILNYDYNTKIVDIISNAEFKEENIDKYIEFSSLYSFDINDIIYIVNNNYYDKNLEYNDLIIDLMKQDYFIYDNLERYLNYQDSITDSDTKAQDIIKMVNSNRDYDYYTNVKDTDLSKGFLIIVNKYNKLSESYVPDDLVIIDSKYGANLYLNSTAYEAYKKMWEDAYNEGLHLYIRSPYRSYSTQVNLYERYASSDGYKEADTYSARAGYSDHQTGLAFDVTTPTTTLGTFEETNEFKWLQENAYKYGFILRFPEGKENITGYIYEPWHYRYVGIEAAKYIYEHDITFEEYYEYFVK